MTLVDLLSQLTSTTNRFEVDGLTKRSICWEDQVGTVKGRAMLVLKDDFEDSTYVTEHNYDYFTFKRADIEKILAEALHTEDNQASGTIIADRTVYFEKWDDWGGTHEGPVRKHYKHMEIPVHIDLSEEPTITFADDEATSKYLEQRIQQLQSLKTIHTVVPREASKNPCPECQSVLSYQGNVESAGGIGSRITVLTFCDSCGYHDIGKPYFDSGSDY